MIEASLEFGKPFFMFSRCFWWRNKIFFKNYDFFCQNSWSTNYNDYICRAELVDQTSIIDSIILKNSIKVIIR